MSGNHDYTHEKAYDRHLLSEKEAQKISIPLDLLFQTLLSH
jgi:hypothetical protein